MITVIVCASVLFFVATGVWAFYESWLERTKFEAAREEYDQLYLEHGHARKEMCPHRILTFSQVGIPEVLALTTKWCKICGKDLGPAALVKSIWGNRWE